MLNIRMLMLALGSKHHCAWSTASQPRFKNQTKILNTNTNGLSVMCLIYSQVWQQCNWLKKKKRKKEKCLCLTFCLIVWTLPTVNGLWSPQRESHRGNDNLSVWLVDQAVPGVGRGEGRSVMWHREAWHQILLERGPKLHLAHEPSVKRGRMAQTQSWPSCKGLATGLTH